MNAYYEIRWPFYYVSFSYDPDLIACLKDEIPRGYRKWVPESKVWQISGDYWGIAAGILTSFGYTLRDADTRRWQQETKAHTNDDTDALRILHLTEGAPPELIVAAYRVLAKIHHPDRGGGNDDMVRINLAYERLRAKTKSE